MNTDTQTEIRDLLMEKPTSYTVLPQAPRSCSVSYYAITPKNSRARFTRTVSLANIRGARSETAVFYYLKGLHPG